jgi:hypothetical protein
MQVRRDGKVFCRIQLPNQHSNGPYRELKYRKDDFDQQYSQFLLLKNVFADKPSALMILDLAETGFELFQEIFSKDQALAVNKLQEEAAAQDLSAGDTVGGDVQNIKRIFVSSENLNIPWELLYSERPPQDTEKDERPVEINTNLFLGYHFFIQEDFNDRAKLEQEVKPFDKDRGVTIFTDKKLPYTLQAEAPAVQSAMQSIGASAQVFPPLDPFKPLTKLDGEVSDRNGRKMGQALRSVNSDILHFACHSEQESSKTGLVTLRVDDNYHITEIEIKRSFPKSAQGAFIFLNSCELAIRSPEKYCNFLAYLAEKEFSGVIATEIKVKDQCAFEFAEAVYREFVSSSVGSLHKALFRARRKLLHQKSLYVGFTYSFYGTNDLIIEEL